jgi:hypothetical protein
VRRGRGKEGRKPKLRKQLEPEVLTFKDSCWGMKEGYYTGISIFLTIGSFDLACFLQLWLFVTERG